MALSKTQIDKTELFENMPVPKAVGKLIVPTVLSSLVMVLYNLADTFFVGMLNDPLETGAVTLAATVLLAFNAVNNLFGVGCASLISRSLGLKDYDTARKTGAFGFWGAIFAGILFSLFCTVAKAPLLSLLGASGDIVKPTGDYMFWTVTLGAVPAILNVVIAQLVKAEGLALHASIGTMSGCLLNMVLDPIFILPWGLNMGAAGAGCATFISNCVACLYFFVMMIAKRGRIVLNVSPKNFVIRKDIVREVFSVGLPASVQNLLNVTGMTILNNFMAAYGAKAVSAIGIAHKMGMIPMYISMGMGQGIMPLVGYNFASGNAERMKKSITFTVKFMLGFAFAAAAAYFIFSENIISLFMKDSEIVSFGGRFLKGFCLAIPFLSLDFLAVGVFQAVGMGGKSLLFAILRKVALEIPALYLLNHFFPLYGLSYSQLIAEAVLAVLSVFMLRNIFRSVGKK